MQVWLQNNLNQMVRRQVTLFLTNMVGKLDQLETPNSNDLATVSLLQCGLYSASICNGNYPQRRMETDTRYEHDMRP